MSYVALADDNIVMTHRLQPGVVPSSFGLGVAKMAGLPQTVLNCARRKAAEFANSRSGYVASSILKASDERDVVALRRLHQCLSCTDFLA